MSLPAGWTVSPSAFRWDLLFHFDDMSDDSPRGSWYRMTSDGRIAATPHPKGASHCFFSPSGARALAIGDNPFNEDGDGSVTGVRSILDLRSGSETQAKFAIGSDPAWSKGEAMIAYRRKPEGWRRLGDGSILATRDLDSGFVREVHARDIWCLQWHPNGRELIAVVSSRREFSLVRFTADDLSQIDEAPLAIEFTANDLSISPDAEFIAFCDDSSDDEEYCAYTYRLSDGLVMPIGPHLIDASLAWSPSGHRLAYRRVSTVEEGDFRKTVAIFDPRTRESVETAPVDSGDDSGEISGPDPAWSPDGQLIAFASYEEEGSAIYVAEASSGKSEKVLQTNGLVHSPGFVGAP